MGEQLGYSFHLQGVWIFTQASTGGMAVRLMIGRHDDL